MSNRRHNRPPHSKRAKEIIERLSERQNHRCCYCGVRFIEILNHPRQRSREHLIPWVEGGTYRQNNLVIACRTCNSDRGDMDVIEYLTKIGVPCDINISEYM